MVYGCIAFSCEVTPNLCDVWEVWRDVKSV